VAFLARKISRAKWDPGPGPGEIRADAVTGDLRTEDDDLSMWICPQSGGLDLPSNLSDVVLALASGSKRVDKIDVAWISIEALHAQGLAPTPTAGETPVASLQDRHVDLQQLDYERLGKVARLLSSAVRNNQVQRFREKQVVSLLVEAVKRNALRPEDLQPDVRERITRNLGEP